MKLQVGPSITYRINAGFICGGKVRERLRFQLQHVDGAEAANFSQRRDR